jgi:phosphatidylserine/phosphatidylglycerophosphate/cardiolipin synthase-like enzyme
MDRQPPSPRLETRRALRPAALAQVPSTGEGMGRVAYADARQHRDILQSLFRALNSGHKRIWLATPYFLPTWKVRRSLRARPRAASTCGCC